MQPVGVAVPSTLHREALGEGAQRQARDLARAERAAGGGGSGHVRHRTGGTAQSPAGDSVRRSGAGVVCVGGTRMLRSAKLMTSLNTGPAVEPP